MIRDPTLAWLGLLALGALHGVNPAMGWLFAVSLGLQERRRGAVWRALAPLALGHAAAIAAALAVALAVGLVVRPGVLKWIVAVLLVGVGIAHLIRHRHPRWGGMRVGAADLTVWSFLMASAHGAGLMALPFLMGTGAAGGTGPGSGGHGAHAAALAGPGPDVAGAAGLAGPLPGWAVGLAGSAVHTAGYLLVTGVVAVAVYEWLGLRLLRKAWINLDLLWALALVATGLLTPLL